MALLCQDLSLIGKITDLQALRAVLLLDLVESLPAHSRPQLIARASLEAEAVARPTVRPHARLVQPPQVAPVVLLAHQLDVWLGDLLQRQLEHRRPEQLTHARASLPPLVMRLHV